MIGKICTATALATCVVMAQLTLAPAASAAELQVSVNSLKNGGVIPNQYRFCVPAEQGHVAPGPDISPAISWSKGPTGTKSYVITLTDIDNVAEQREKHEQRRHDGSSDGSAAERCSTGSWSIFRRTSRRCPKALNRKVACRTANRQTPAKVGVARTQHLHRFSRRPASR